jgi:drug/metabolite transporter (DMT)-like permease
MQERLDWIVWGGICFGLPSVVSVVLDPNLDTGGFLRTFIILPLAGTAFLCAANWIASRREPKWGWILAGILILGPIVPLAVSVVQPSLFLPRYRDLHVFSFSPRAISRLILFCLVPMIPSQLIITWVFGLMWLRPKRTAH